VALFYLEEVATKQTHALIGIYMWVYHFGRLNARRQSPIGALNPEAPVPATLPPQIERHKLS
jgi:hypothetical protein